VHVFARGSNEHSLDNPILKEDREIYWVNNSGLTNSLNLKVAELLPVWVNRVIDGNTMLVDILNPPENSGFRRREIVRLVGVSIEEESVVPGSRPRQQQQPSRFSENSLYLTRELAQEKIVYLAFDTEMQRDRDGRIYAYLYFSDGSCLNRILIWQGEARVDWYSFYFLDEYTRLENNARNTKTGRW
jgi:endonuclease YncB( thermonuclease family)